MFTLFQKDILRRRKFIKMHLKQKKKTRKSSSVFLCHLPSANHHFSLPGSLMIPHLVYIHLLSPTAGECSVSFKKPWGFPKQRSQLFRSLMEILNLQKKKNEQRILQGERGRQGRNQTQEKTNQFANSIINYYSLHIQECKSRIIKILL